MGETNMATIRQEMAYQMPPRDAARKGDETR